MHLFAQLLLSDLEESRNDLVDLFEKLTPQQWKNKIPGSNKTVQELAGHILTDSKRLAILAPIAGIYDLFPKPTTEGSYSCVWDNEQITLSPQNIFSRSKYERNKLRTLLTLVRDKKQTKEIYKSNFQSGWHERIHLFDLQESISGVGKQITILPDMQIFVDEFIKTLNALPFLYDIVQNRFDEIAKTNQTYRQELKFLAGDHFATRFHKHLNLQNHLQGIKGNANGLQYVHNIHRLHNDMILHVKELDVQKLQEIIDGKSLSKRLMKVARDFREKVMLFKSINLADSWARDAGL